MVLEETAKVNFLRFFLRLCRRRGKEQQRLQRLRKQRDIDLHRVPRKKKATLKEAKRGTMNDLEPKVQVHLVLRPYVLTQTQSRRVRRLVHQPRRVRGLVQQARHKVTGDIPWHPRPDHTHPHQEPLHPTCARS